MFHYVLCIYQNIMLNETVFFVDINFCWYFWYYTPYIWKNNFRKLVEKSKVKVKNKEKEKSYQKSLKRHYCFLHDNVFIIVRIRPDAKRLLNQKITLIHTKSFFSNVALAVHLFCRVFFFVLLLSFWAFRMRLCIGFTAEATPKPFLSNNWQIGNKISQNFWVLILQCV